MEIVRVADWLMNVAEQRGIEVSACLGESEGELLFYALKGLTLDTDHAPLFLLKFEWPTAYYSTSFFATLFEMMVDDVAFPYFAHLLRVSDLYACDELSRLVEQAFDRIGLEPEVLA